MSPSSKPKKVLVIGGGPAGMKAACVAAKRGHRVTLVQVRKAIAAFERTLLSGGSAYDRAVYRDERAALSPQARRGLRLFTSPELACSECHGGPTLGGADAAFHNTGLFNLDGLGAYPQNGQGLFARTRAPSDMGRFRAPSLRNIALTAPYMHDGSVATLRDVLSHYARGGRNLARETGDVRGVRNPHQSDRVRGFALSAEDETALSRRSRSPARRI